MHENPPVHLKIACPILLQEKEEGSQSASYSNTTARNARCFNDYEHFKSGVKIGLLKDLLCHSLTAKSTNHAIKPFIAGLL